MNHKPKIMTKAHLKIEITPPVECTPKQLKDWINFELLREGSLDISNPLFNFSIDERTITVLEYRTKED